MDQEQKNKEFFKIADSFIDVANKHCDEEDSSRVGQAILFATARFSAFVVASKTQDLQSFEAEIDEAVEFFNKEFKRMLTENMEEYKGVFKQQEEAKYSHLMKKK